MMKCQSIFYAKSNNCMQIGGSLMNKAEVQGEHWISVKL